MFSAIATVIGVSWLIENWKIVLVIAVLIILLIILAVRKKKKRTAAYMAMPVICIGNRETRVYHMPSCRFLHNANKSNLVYFRTNDEIRRSGYKTCGSCMNHNY